VLVGILRGAQGENDRETGITDKEIGARLKLRDGTIRFDIPRDQTDYDANGEQKLSVEQDLGGIHKLKVAHVSFAGLRNDRIEAELGDLFKPGFGDAAQFSVSRA
jgi:hypothetical protein